MKSMRGLLRAIFRLMRCRKEHREYEALLFIGVVGDSERLPWCPVNFKKGKTRIDEPPDRCGPHDRPAIVAKHFQRS
jgi:hypothetical protein